MTSGDASPEQERSDRLLRTSGPDGTDIHTRHARDGLLGALMSVTGCHSVMSCRTAQPTTLCTTCSYRCPRHSVARRSQTACPCAARPLACRPTCRRAPGRQPPPVTPCPWQSGPLMTRQECGCGSLTRPRCAHGLGRSLVPPWSFLSDSLWIALP